MPFRLTRTDRNLLLVVAGLALLLVVAAAILAARPDTSQVPTTYSAGSGGAKAVYLALARAGYRVRRWERSPLDLPIGESATIVYAEPRDVPTMEERSAVGRFAAAGGRVIATGSIGAFLLADTGATPEPPSAAVWARVPAAAPSRFARAAPAITLAVPMSASAGTGLVLYADADGARVVAPATGGGGERLWWAAPTPLTNAGITAEGNLAFVLAALGDPHRTIWFDEYFHGYREAGPAGAASSPFAWIGAQIALLALLAVATYSRRSGPVLPGPADGRASPLEFVRTLGSLYQRAGAAPVAVDVSLQRFRFHLARRLGLSPHDTAETLARTAHERLAADETELLSLVQTAESASRDASLSAARALALTRALHDAAGRLDLYT